MPVLSVGHCQVNYPCSFPVSSLHSEFSRIQFRRKLRKQNKVEANEWSGTKKIKATMFECTGWPWIFSRIISQIAFWDDIAKVTPLTRPWAAQGPEAKLEA